MKALILLLPSLAFFAFYGCIDEPNNIKLETINGVVYDMQGVPVPSLYVSSNNISLYRTNYNGKFILDNVSIPYNIFVSTGSDYFTSYFGIKSKNPNVITILGNSPKGQRMLIVHFPPLQPGRSLILKLIGDNYHEQDKYFFHVHYATSVMILIDVLINETSVNGKLLYLEGSGNSYEIYNYEKFGIKDFTFQPYETHVTFTTEDIRYNPEEREMTIYSPGNGELQHYYSEAYLYIDNIYNEFMLDMDAYSSYSYFTVPVLPNLEYDIKIVDQLRGNDWEQSTKWVHLQPGEDATIVHDPCPSILTPVNNATGITNTTTFAISDNSLDPSIYQYSFWLMTDGSGSYFVYDIYTDKKIFKPEELIGGQFTFPPMKKFRWYVYKISNYNSMDEFVSTPFVLDSRYTSLQNSKKFKFTTAP